MASRTIPWTRIPAHDALYAPSNPAHTSVTLNDPFTLSADASNYELIEVSFSRGTSATIGLVLVPSAQTGNRCYSVACGSTTGYVRFAVSGTSLTVVESDISGLCLHRVFGVS